MQDIYNFKIFELQRINKGIDSYRNALSEIEDKINYSELIQDKDILISEKGKLQKELEYLETNKEKLNEELANSEGLSQLIKMKYALLLSNYAVYHDNPTSKPKKEAKTFIQKILNFNKAK